MHCDTPFLTADCAIEEGCRWLQDLTRAQNDPLNECESHDLAWDQACAHFSCAIADLEAHGSILVEAGGTDVPQYGWLPAYASVVADKEAMAAVMAVKGLFEPLQDLVDVAQIAAAVTPELIACMRNALAPFEGRLSDERVLLDAQCEPD